MSKDEKWSKFEVRPQISYAPAEGSTVSAPASREVVIGNTIWQRLEITRSKDAAQKQLHLYESYWVPKRELLKKL
jgi:hypothetical protein